MTFVWIGLAVLLLVIITFLIYRYVSFRRESRKHNEEKFERVKPLYDKLELSGPLAMEDVFPFSENILTRTTTYELLSSYDLQNLIPAEFNTIQKAAESYLACWLEFPTELEKIPDEIEHVEKVIIDFDGNNVIYHVYKFRTDPPHWAANNGWMLGVVGPYFDDSNPYDYPKSTFSRLSKLTDVTASEEANWVHKNLSLRIH